MRTSLPQAPERAVPRASGGWRSTLVTLGPPLVLDLALGAAVAGSAVGALVPTRGGRVLRLTRPLAAVGALVPWAYLLAIRPAFANWGATDDEQRCPLPGDDLVPHPLYEYTRAITIEVPAQAVWPWLAQIGQGRGGFYSFDWLEDLAGLGIHSADRILPEHQRHQVGEIVPFAADGGGLRLAVFEPPHAFVMHGVLDLATGGQVEPNAPPPARGFAASWAFLLAPVDTRITRLLVRFRIDGFPRRALGLMQPLLVEIPHFVMEWAMLRGIKQRAEHTLA